VAFDKILNNTRYFHYSNSESFSAKYVDPADNVVRQYTALGEKVEWRGCVPPIRLVVQFKRFLQNYETGIPSKLETAIDVPMECDFARHFWRPKSNYTRAAKRCGVYVDMQYSYELTGFVHHRSFQGNALKGGHYTSYVKTAPGIWWWVNDEQVIPIDCQAESFQHAKNESYLAFYNRITINSPALNNAH
jgi:ubiquitin C-terminal hydrolase